MSYEVILKTGLPLAGDSTSGDRQGTTLAPFTNCTIHQAAWLPAAGEAVNPLTSWIVL